MVTVDVLVSGKIAAQVEYSDLPTAIQEITEGAWDPEDEELMRTVYTIRRRQTGMVLATGFYSREERVRLNSSRPVLRWVETTSNNDRLYVYENVYRSHINRERMKKDVESISIEDVDELLNRSRAIREELERIEKMAMEG